MSVFSRLSDIINSNVNAILEQAEDPEKMVRMITQEMEETLVEVRSASARYIADRKHLTARIEWLKRESGAWEEKAELAINKGRDDLARAALHEKSRHDEAVSLLAADLETIDSAIAKLKHDSAQLEEKLRNARTRQKALIMRGKTARSRIKVKRQIHDVSCDQAFDRFEQYERHLDEMEGEIESYELTNRTLADEISELENNEQIDAQLQALKARISDQSRANS
ncbi:MAG: phage shock protein PspA [Pseudomonadales bacterium]